MMKLKIFLLINLLIIMMGLLPIYLFFKQPGPIQEYEFPRMTYQELEVKISKIIDNKANSKFKLTDEELNNKNTRNTRIVILGKDSLQFGFVTNMDIGYEYKTKNNHSKNCPPWLELYSICNSNGNFLGVVRKNREEHAELIKLFEDEFIKKINNGAVNVIERGFWDNIF
ncbi:hypothetical protein [Flavobacterium flavipallidum]|uniref:Uncharacterized protein n=1 Tax=Flavobacterium flavipallidum TaxID=3139140 RepID=A0ABU9HQP5_9FLAO